MKARSDNSASLARAFDEARFGAARTLNLRQSLPTVTEAVERADKWLRQQQAAGTGEVLVITGRGNRSDDGTSPVRTAVVRQLQSLRRQGVVDSFQEHTPGSFVLRLAPLRAMVEAPRRRRERDRGPSPTPPPIEGLDAESLGLLRELATRALEELGIPRDEQFLRDEMQRQYTRLAVAVQQLPDREARLRDSIRLAIDEYD